MKPLHKNVAIAIDGGGIKGVMVAKALSMLEEHLGNHGLAILSYAQDGASM